MVPSAWRTLTLGYRLCKVGERRVWGPLCRVGGTLSVFWHFSATHHRLCLYTGSCQFCPVGWLWHAGHCYYFSSAKRSWEQSKEDCCSRGAQLAIIQANSTLVSTRLAAPTSPWSLDGISVSQ